MNIEVASSPVCSCSSTHSEQFCPAFMIYSTDLSETVSRDSGPPLSERKVVMKN